MKRKLRHFDKSSVPEILPLLHLLQRKTNPISDTPAVAVAGQHGCQTWFDHSFVGLTTLKFGPVSGVDNPFLGGVWVHRHLGENKMRGSAERMRRLAAER